MATTLLLPRIVAETLRLRLRFSHVNSEGVYFPSLFVDQTDDSGVVINQIT